MDHLSQSFFYNKIEELEGKIHQLRISRRVLMNLIENIEREKNITINQFAKENKKLKTSNARYVKKIMDLKNNP